MGVVPAFDELEDCYAGLSLGFEAAARGIEVLSPLRENPSFHIDPLTPQPRDSPALAAYRLRMPSAEGKDIYKERTSTAETVNADLKTLRGLDRLLVRGLSKVLTVALWSALTYQPDAGDNGLAMRPLPQGATLLLTHP